MLNVKTFGIGHRGVLGLGLTVVFTSISALGAVWGQGEFTRQRNAGQLQELSQQVVQRAELAIDYAVITLAEVIAPSAALCNFETLSVLRQQVFLRGAVKDISVLGSDGQLQCATSPVASDEIVNELRTADTYPSRNSAIALQPSHIPASGLFRVIWDLDAGHAIAATLNIDTLMFDIFPSAIRDNAQAEVEIGDGHVVARFGENADPALGQSGWRFAASSARYPVSVLLQVSNDSFLDWNTGSWPLAALLGGTFGLVLGGLVARVLLPPAGPTDRLRNAIHDGEIVPFYQPIFDLSSRRIVGCEVLVRWIKPDGTIVFPDRFIPFAETCDLIVPMTERVIAQALEALSSVLNAEPGFKVAFNIAPSHFVRSGFLDKLDALAEEAGVPAKQIVLELTERTSFDDMTQATGLAAQAHQRGYRISLDDTGAGQNGLSHIQDLNPSVIKIDKKFVDGVGMDPTADAIVGVLVGLARQIGASLVAEGVEHDRQAVALAGAGVEEGQGYLVSKPLSLEAFSAFLRSGLHESAPSNGNTRDAA